MKFRTGSKNGLIEKWMIVVECLCFYNHNIYRRFVEPNMTANEMSEKL